MSRADRRAVPRDDAERFESLIRALDAADVPPPEARELWRATAGCVHLGAVGFDRVGDAGDEDEEIDTLPDFLMNPPSRARQPPNVRGTSASICFMTTSRFLCFICSAKYTLSSMSYVKVSAENKVG